MTTEGRSVGAAICAFLQREMDAVATSDTDKHASLQVAFECLRQVYKFPTDLMDNAPLLETIVAANSSVSDDTDEQIDASVIEEANALKEKGNEFYRNKDLDSAVDAYTQAINLHESHIYYSNRCAALIALKQYDAALADAKKAIVMDPTYARAHARLGQIYTAMGEEREALNAYKQAAAVDPSNASYATHIKRLEDKFGVVEEPDDGDDGVQSTQQQQQQQQQPSTQQAPQMDLSGLLGGLLGNMNASTTASQANDGNTDGMADDDAQQQQQQGSATPGGGLDFSALLSNPAVMNMAQSVMANPEMMNMFSGMARNNGNNGSTQ